MDGGSTYTGYEYPLIIRSEYGSVWVHPDSENSEDRFFFRRDATNHKSYGDFPRLRINGTDTSTSTTTGALVVTGGAGIGGNLNVGGIYTPSYQQVNATGTNQSTAIELSANVVKVLYGSSGGVRLPAVPAGTSIRIRSNLSTSLNVYPPSGQEISTAGGTDLAYSQIPYSIREYQFYNDLWFVMDLL